MERENTEGEVPGRWRTVGVHPESPALASIDAGGADDAAARFATEDLIARRQRVRWIGQQAVESATLAGTLIDLAERHSRVALRVASRSHRGRITRVGTNYIELSTGAGAPRLIRSSAITMLLIASTERPPMGDRRSGPATLHEELANRVAERPRVAVFVTEQGAPIVGQLWTCGIDVITIRIDGEDQRWCIVATDRIEEVTCLDA